MLKKTVKERINMSKIKEHPWFLNKKLKRAFTIVEEVEEGFQEEEKIEIPKHPRKYQS